jgi:hypothetical protein
MTWSRKLIPPLVLKDGRVLATLSDARDMLSGLAEGQQQASYWQHAAALLLYAAEIEKEAIDDVRAQLNRALYRDGFM